MKKIEVKVRYLFEGTYTVAADDRNEARTMVTRDCCLLYTSFHLVEAAGGPCLLIHQQLIPGLGHGVGQIVGVHQLAPLVKGAAGHLGHQEVVELLDVGLQVGLGIVCLLYTSRCVSETGIAHPGENSKGRMQESPEDGAFGLSRCGEGDITSSGLSFPRSSWG